MKKILVLILLINSFNLFPLESTHKFLAQIEQDSLSYAKSSDFSKQREFKEDLKTKYNSRDFIYKEEKVKKRNTPKINNNSLGFLKGLASFMGTIFPYLLALIVIFILVKTFVYNDKDFWKFSKLKKKVSKKIIYSEEEDNIDENDYEKLLLRAIKNKEYRLATRYYYLSVLKKMNHKELIDFHKDKTNSQYLFELKDSEIRKQFSYLLYIYDYVWYGEFPVNELQFNTIEDSYKDFIKKI
ncbi:conserved hypothetical protein [Tenacibaculum sp. 190524A02b]|uniref:DUF4129 domain-containing protein n=1 Tax=Tenacibaculum vairaonense TaxID=3137860 RepID=A0ABP1FD62_9FLAO